MIKRLSAVGLRFLINAPTGARGEIMKEKFKKGKWEVDSSCTAFYISSNEVPVCEIDLIITEPTEEQMANAHLIAAAPEMYETLLKISNEMGCFHGVDTESIDLLLAKARGEL